MKARVSMVVIAMSICGAAIINGQDRGVPQSVAFFSARSGNNEIYLMNPDGTDPVQITHDPASDADPDVSTNGREIVFTSNRTGNNDIFVTDSNGINVWNLTNNPANDGWPRWSPNGQQIAFHSNREDDDDEISDYDIYVMDADGSNLTQVTTYPGVDQYPDWSPNGKELMFRRDMDIYAVDLADGTVRRLTKGAGLNQMAVWSPNGRRIVFMSNREGYCSVFVMNDDGSDQTNLTPKDPGDTDAEWCSRAPSWSRNGRQIYFMSSRPSTQGDAEIFVMNADGTEVRRLTYSLGTDGSPRAR